MMRLLCVGLCATFGFTSVGWAQPKPEPPAPSDAAVIRAAALPPVGLHGDVTIVKQLAAGGQWKCTVYYSTLEPVPLPRGGWILLPKPRVREVLFDRPGQKA